MVKSKKKVIKNYSKLIGGLRYNNSNTFTLKKNRKDEVPNFKSSSEILIPSQIYTQKKSLNFNSSSETDTTDTTDTSYTNKIDSFSNTEQKNKMDMHNILSNLHYGKYINTFYNTADLKQKPLKFKTKSRQDESNSIPEQEKIIKSNLSNSEIMSRICDFD